MSLDNVEWEEGVKFVDEDVVEEGDAQDRPCESCGEREVHSCMAETEEEGLGPAIACVSCGHVERI